MEDTPRRPNPHLDLEDGGDREVEDLRLRISQLEHLFVTSSVDGSLSKETLHNFSLNASSTLKDATISTLIERTSQLESLLAASESDNSRLLQQLQNTSISVDYSRVEFTEALRAKESQVKDLNCQLQLLSLKLAKEEKRYGALEEYVQSLPSEEELSQAKDKVKTLEGETNYLLGKVCRLKGRLISTQERLQEKEKALKSAHLKLKHLSPLEEAFNTPSEFQGTADEDTKKFITLQRANLIRAAKIINSLRMSGQKTEVEKNEMVKKVEELEEHVYALKEELTSARMEAQELRLKLEVAHKENSGLKEEVVRLESDLSEKEGWIATREEQMEGLIELVAEIDLCMSDMGSLVGVTEQMVKGEEPELGGLFGLSEFEEKGVEKVDLSDKGWILERWGRVRELRGRLGVLRSRTGDLYTETLGRSLDGCSTQ